MALALKTIRRPELRGLLGASLSTGRANRRSAQAGFAGFGDAVRSEAEFLEILASLENADMQDPNMRAARTTATAPDMHINVDSDQLTKRRYDDINGYVADPLAFYLDKFDPDVWSEEEKAIFARRYALWPKQFGKIAQALPHKTPSQCVRYYYLNKKEPGNDFKALAAARNRERKRKARGKPKKAKGSALMADLKSAKGEEVDDVDDGSGLRSPMDATDPSAASADVVVSSNGRRGGRGRINPAGADGVAGSTDEATAGRKRAAEQGESETPVSDAKASDKRRSGPKSKRAKSDSAMRPRSHASPSLVARKTWRRSRKSLQRSFPTWLLSHRNARRPTWRQRETLPLVLPRLPPMPRQGSRTVTLRRRKPWERLLVSSEGQLLVAKNSAQMVLLLPQHHRPQNRLYTAR